MDWTDGFEVICKNQESYVVGSRVEKLGYLYRFADINNVIHICEYGIVASTPCGDWIEDYGRRRWVSNTAKKRYAYPTQKEAWDSYAIRKAFQLEHLTRQLNNCKAINDRLREGLDGLD